MDLAKHFTLIDFCFIILIIGIAVGGYLYLTQDYEVNVIYSDYDINNFIQYTGLTKDEFLRALNSDLSKNNLSKFERAETLFTIGKIKKNNSYILDAIDLYKNYKPSSEEEQALIYETIASTGDLRYYKKAARIWHKLGIDWRANIDYALAEPINDTNTTLDLDYNFKLDTSDNIDMNEFNSKEIKQIELDNNDELIIGSTSFEIDKDDVVVAQTERVTRDWLGLQIKDIYSKNILITFSERLFYDDRDLREDIGWHEGGRIKDLAISPKIASGTIIKNFDNKWYAPDENGIYRFQVTDDKAFYPTNRILKEDLILIIDTHGISSLVEQAVRLKADYVIGCCDFPGKIDAINYLDEKGIKTICFTDRFVYLDLMTDVDVIGSAPITVENDEETNTTKTIIGNRPIAITKNDKIIALDATGNAQMYYDTPAHYFQTLNKYYNLDIEYITITDINQMHKITEKARSKNATIIAARVFNLNDYQTLKTWLDESEKNKLILFHSMPYPYGKILFDEFPEQTSFGDAKIII